ncbi:hypothetical protein Tco_0027686, partial [Tanacetum coccineum]
WMEVGKGMMLTSAKKCPTFAGWCDIKASADPIRGPPTPSFLMLVRPWDQADFDWWVVCSQLEGCLILKVLMLLQSSS